LKWEVSKGPSYSLLKVMLGPGESVSSEPGAMVLMRGFLRIKTHSGGLGSALKRALFGGESFFINTYEADGSSEVWFAPPLPGDIAYLPLKGNAYFIQDMAYLAHHGKVDITIGWRGFKGVFTSGGIVWLKAKGHGGVWVTAFGGLEEIELGPGESITVDNYHFVAMEEGMEWSLRKFGGIKSFLLGGEGIVVEVKGPGKLYIQTRSLPPFIGLLAKLMPHR